MTRVLVCGGRDFNDRTTLHAVLNGFHALVPITTLICGMARGADLLAYGWALEYGVPVAKYPAEWDKYGKSAGYKRNTQMLVDGKPDVVIAFPGGKGTKMMKDIAMLAGVNVQEVDYE